MAASKEKVTEIINCSICQFAWKKSKALPCRHIICLQCLVKYGREGDRDEPGDELPCPLCRQIFRVPAGGFDELPTTFFVENLFKTLSESLQSLKALETNFHRCGICEKNDAVILCDEHAL